jgi:3-methyladenine DNA glycosylase/8-oxoguanine DNA glycosylase
MISRYRLILTYNFLQNCTIRQIMSARSTRPKRSLQKLDIEAIVDKALKDAEITNTQTKDGWCLKEGLIHVCSVNGGHLLPLLERHGPPTYYHHAPSKDHCKHSPDSPTDNMKAPSNAFESLCRIVAGQQLAGAAAQAVWRRLLNTTKNNLTPETILSLADNDGLVDNLQKPAGLSRAKANAIVDLSNHFLRGNLTEEMLHSAPEQDVREALLQVRGLGPWSCDMFLMFTLERSNILPVGDLGVRKGLSKAFSMRGSAKGGSLCPKKDLRTIHATAEPFAPFHSLLSFFMWKAADTVDFYNSPVKSKRAKVVVTP